MGISVIYSVKEHLADLIRDLHAQAGDVTPRMVLYFASSRFQADEISHRMQQLFPDVSVFGCSTAGEIVTGKMLKGSVVAMLFSEDVLEDVAIEVIERISTENQIPETFTRFEDYYGLPITEMDYRKYVGIVLFDGMSLAEERLMDAIGNVTHMTFIGGSAGDDLRFRETYVYANGKAYTDAAILALLKPRVGFDVIKTQSFCPLNKTLLATKVNEANREVLEFNHQPAVEAYANAIGIPADKADDAFSKHPLGLMVGDEPYVRSPQQILPDNGIRFYCHIKEGMELDILETANIIADTTQAIRQKREELGTISGLINFHCILRTLELEEAELTEAYGHIFDEFPAIGFSTYGEEYIGHLNQTSTMLVFR